LIEAERFGVRRPLDLLADVRAALDNWPKFANEAGLNTTTANAIADDFELI
jgi:serine/threonine-protein kinase HipA